MLDSRHSLLDIENRESDIEERLMYYKKARLKTEMSFDLAFGSEAQARREALDRPRTFPALPLVLFVLLLSVGVAADSEKKDWPNKDSSLGINLAGVTYWSTEIVFVDLFKHSQTWKSQAPGKKYAQGGPLDLTENGWGRPLADNGQVADSVILRSINER